MLTEQSIIDFISNYDFVSISKLKEDIMAYLKDDSIIKQINNYVIDEYSIFDLYLRPTFDLEQEILWNGEEVEVLAPKEFRERIAERIDLMGKNYGLK